MSMSIANIILHGSLEQLRQALPSVEDIDIIDEYGYTPLIETAIVDDLEKARAVLDAGADPNFKDLTGRTALHWATDNKDLELTRLLLDRGANANAYTTAGQPILGPPLLRKQRSLIDLLLKRGASLSFAQDFVNAKLLAHRFLLRGRVDIVDPKKNELIEIDYEGFYIESSLTFLLNSAKDFINNFQARSLRDYFPQIKTALASLENATQLMKLQHYLIEHDEYLEHINKLLDRELLILPVAYEGHAISIIKYKNLLVRCDRGEYGKENGTVIFYEVGNSHMLTNDFLMKLIYQKLSRKFVNEDLVYLLGLKKVFTLPLPEQSSGNCSWANIEAALLASVFLLFLGDTKMIREMNHAADCEHKAFHIYESWMQWDRDRSLDFCIESFGSADDLRKVSKASILTAIFVQQCRYEDLHDLERVKRLIPIVAQSRYSYILKIYLDIFREANNQKIIDKIENYLDDFGIDL